MNNDNINMARACMDHLVFNWSESKEEKYGSVYLIERKDFCQILISLSIDEYSNSF